MDTKQLIMFAIVCLVNAVLARLLLRNLNYFLMSRGIYGIDVNKPTRNKVPEEGGVSLCISFTFSIALLGYLWKLSWVLPLIITTVLICLVGFIDHFRNIKPLPKVFYSFSIGLVYYILLANNPQYSVIGSLVYIIFIGVIYAVSVNAFNMLAGFNGLESGITVISSLALAGYYYLNNQEYASAILILLAVTYAVIWQLNKYPAQIFLGDSGTLIPASVYVGLSVYTSHWWPLLFVLGPHLINIIIKFASTGISSRSDHQPLVYKNGLLQLPEKNYWSIIRLYLAFSGPRTEQEIVNFVYSTEMLFCIAMLAGLFGGLL